MKNNIDENDIYNSEEKLTKSNFKLLERDFKDIIINREEKDNDGKTSTRLVTRKTYKLRDFSFISITEFYTGENLDIIDRYNYDWYNKDKTIKLKFHSESHPDKEHQTDTEPHHVHKPNKLGLKSKERFPNYCHRRLFEILELIRFTID